jgi:hypothetical protein
MLRLILRLVPVKAAQSTEHRAQSTEQRAQGTEQKTLNLKTKNENRGEAELAEGKRETINDL